jgi:hypothetical protein
MFSSHTAFAKKKSRTNSTIRLTVSVCMYCSNNLRAAERVFMKCTEELTNLYASKILFELGLQ